MTRLIVQADDLAISHAATLGIVEAVEHRLVRATGLFANQPDAAYAAARLRDVAGLDLGMDLNLVTGRPLLPLAEVAGLVAADGTFRTSHAIRAAHTVVRASAGPGIVEFEVDPFPHDQALAEARAQLRRFVEFVGRPPAYVHHHSLATPVTDLVLHEIADECGALVMDDLYRHGRVNLLPNAWYAAPFTLDAQAASDPIADVAALIPEMLAHPVNVLITHPGYVDGELLDASSFSIVRARDQQLVTSAEVTRLLADAGIEVTSFSELCSELG